MKIQLDPKALAISVAIIAVVSITSVLLMRGYALDQDPVTVATWAALATFGMPLSLLIGLSIGYRGSRERIIGIEQGAEIMAESSRTVVNVRKSMPQISIRPAQPRSPVTQTADVVVRPRTARPDQKSSVDVVEMG